MLRFDAVALDRGGRRLFDGLDLAIGPGEALHVAGPNGAGKSSLLRLAAGLLEAASGRVERAVQLALADDHAALDREVTLERALGLWIAAPVPALEILGAAHLAKVPVRLLSSGQLKRASLARVVGSGARLWLLDEPLNALDDEGAIRLAQAIAGHRKAGGAVIAASHSPLPGDWAKLRLGE